MLQDYQTKVIEEAAAHQISWYIIPPRSPNFGGLCFFNLSSWKHTFKGGGVCLVLFHKCVFFNSFSHLGNNVTFNVNKDLFLILHHYQTYKILFTLQHSFSFSSLHFPFITMILNIPLLRVSHFISLFI